MLNKILISLLAKLDLTELLKDKRLRWSAKRTIGALIAVTACNDIVANGVTWMNVCLCFVAVLPLCLALLENDEKPSVVERIMIAKEKRKNKND
jgi:hypothetical protein|tara:strand:- start:46 stop:327 length:282 start_codon:yes stop_codon:yes gene_type:complete